MPVLAHWVFFSVPDAPLRELLLSLKSLGLSAGAASEMFAKGSAGLGGPSCGCAGLQYP